ncbi:MAG TPA: nuclear transport factor 2 family protein [Acidimicrobiia bacterium]
MDIIDRHFAAENAHDVEATLATYTEDIVWDDVTHPHGPFHGKDAVATVYGGILEAIPDLLLTSVRRFGSADGTFVVDESIVTGHLDGFWAGVEGEGAPVEVRLLHVFRLRDGLIEYENAWFDSGSVRRQVQAWISRKARLDDGQSAR